MRELDENDVWVRTQPSPDGTTYMVTVELGMDRAVTLTRGGAMRWAMGVLTAVAYAEYDEIVFKQLSELVPDPKAAGQVIVDLRNDRPPLDPKMTHPLRLVPGLSAQRGVGYLELYLDGQEGQWGQLDLGPARIHAHTVMEAVVGADLDALYLKELRGLIGLPEHTARRVVDDLQRLRSE